MEVKDHVILFLDILGYKNLINNCDDENKYLLEIHNLMESLSNYIEERNRCIDETGKYNMNLSRFKYLIFSDNILFFAPYDTEIDMQNLYSNLMYGLSAFLFQYKKCDIFFRGAITKGPLYYDEKLHFVFGTGLIKAYELENCKAKYPRIVIDDCLNPSPILVGWEKDNEDIWYLDYMLLGYCLMHNAQMEEQMLSKEEVYNLIEEHKIAVTDAISKYSNDKHILEKYIWLEKYHNKFCKRSKMEQLVISLNNSPVLV